MKNPNRYEFDIDFKISCVYDSITDFILAIDNIHSFFVSAYTFADTCTTVGLSGKAITTPNNCISKFVNPDTKNTSANKVDKRFINAK